MKKIILVSIILFSVLFSFSCANALTQQEKQNLINQIQQRILQLQSQMSAQNQGQYQVSGVWCYDFTKSLGIGDYGQEVFNLKTALNKEGLLDVSLINFNFDSSAFDAVVLFQEKYKKDILSPSGLKKGTGKAGKATIAKLNKIYNCGQLSKCAPVWSCNEWSACKNNKQTRKCADAKNCKILLGKPAEEQQCSIPSVKILGNNIEKKISINYGDAITVSWTGSNVVSCSGSGNWQGALSVSGTMNTGNLTSSKTYNISCKDSVGKIVSGSLDVVIIMPEVDIKAGKKDGSATISAGQSENLSWTAKGVKSCWAFGDWSGEKPLSGSESSGYLNSAKKYIFGLNCNSNKGVISDKVEVNVLSSVANLKANGTDGLLEIASGKTVSLSWTSTGLYSCSALGDWSGSKKVSGSEQIGAVTSQKFYVLECQDLLGNKISDTVSVKIK